MHRIARIFPGRNSDVAVQTDCREEFGNAKTFAGRYHDGDTPKLARPVAAYDASDPFG